MLNAGPERQKARGGVPPGALVLVIIAVLVAAFPVRAQRADDRYEFHIDEGSLGPAMEEFQRVSRVQLLFSNDLAATEGINSLHGRHTIDEALDIMLRDTGLTSGLTESGMIVITRASSREGEMASRNPKESLLVGVATFLFGAGANAQDMKAGSDEPDEEHNSRRVEEIIVTGTNIRGVGAVGAASVTVSRLELENSGFGTIAEFFESLPQNLDEMSSDGAFAAGASDISTANRGNSAASISLRGLGPGSTLTLLNGKRRPGNLRGRAVDVSAIPLAMIERVEVVTGGRSAIYGSDAVAGVVNIVTRTSYEGAETKVYYGGASAGGERLNVSQTFGRAIDRGGFVLGYNYSEEKAFDANEAGAASGPTSIGRTPILFTLQHPSEQHAGLFSGNFRLSDKVELYADAHFSTEDTEVTLIEELAFGLAQRGAKQTIRSKQYSVAGGLRMDFAGRWIADLSVLHGIVDNEAPFVNLIAFAPETIDLTSPFTDQDEDKAKLTSFSAIADGPLGAFGNIDLAAAIGVEYRQESYESARVALSTGARTPQENGDRDIWSVFGEVYVPLIKRGERGLDVSLAGRFDHYSDFGDTFNPQFGLSWVPADGLTLRGSYSTAFRAPDLFTLAFDTQVLVSNVPDPLAPPGGTSPTFGEFGGNPDLQPEEADTWTAGFDWAPWAGGQLSLSYFNIKYDNRIGIPGGALTTVLANEDSLSGLINRSPTSAEVAEVINRSDLSSFLNFTGIPFDPATDDPLSVFPGLVLYDGRNNNIATEEVDGVDFRASGEFETELGDWSAGLNGTYYLNFTRKVTPTAPAIDQLNSPGKLVDLRLRGHVGWSESAWSINAHVNYVDDYVDTFAATPTKIDSWTTVDLSIAFDASEMTGQALLNGFKATLGANNLFDEDPPVFLSNTFGLRYDTANANPFGRFVWLRLSKRW